MRLASKRKMPFLEWSITLFILRTTLARFWSGINLSRAESLTFNTVIRDHPSCMRDRNSFRGNPSPPSCATREGEIWYSYIRCYMYMCMLPWSNELLSAGVITIFFPLCDVRYRHKNYVTNMLICILLTGSSLKCTWSTDFSQENVFMMIITSRQWEPEVRQSSI